MMAPDEGPDRTFVGTPSSFRNWPSRRTRCKNSHGRRCLRGRRPAPVQQQPSRSAARTVDGGDICQVDNHFLIGLSARTNEAGAAQLAAILARHQYTSSTVDIRGHTTLLHLKSGIAYLGERRFLVAPGFPPIRGLADTQRIEVAASETYAANAVRVNDDVLIAAPFPELADALTKLGCRIRALDMSEFAKMDGGLSCLSLRF